ncbi:hypothetical protein PR048_019206 [Dryococelus australis]|uniref:SCAN domain-containing protein n=1 Tax=Dryococelus australis TaxID=614101 RepID=A0ABQ9H2U4_9NEOP|nr:hypothetical protein PR048_019206 [Dryococelus australis]
MQGAEQRADSLTPVQYSRVSQIGGSGGNPDDGEGEVGPPPQRWAAALRDILERMKTLKWQWAGHTARRSDDIWTTAVMDWIPRDLKISRGRLPDHWGRDIRRAVESDKDEDVLSENSTREDMNDQQFVVTLSPEEWSMMKPEERMNKCVDKDKPNRRTGPTTLSLPTGTRRRSALEELVEKNVSACTVRREEARRSMHLGDNEPSHIPTLNALRLAKSRELKSRRVDDDPILAVGKLKYSAEYYSSMREIGLDPFHLFYWTPAQLCVYQEYCKNHPFPTVTSDATGKITAKLKHPFGNVSGVVYLYSVAVHDHEVGVQYTVANMLSESHNNLRIHHFLESWLRNGAPVPKEAVCDKFSGPSLWIRLNTSLQSAIDKILDEDNCPKENSFPEGVENENETPTDFMKWAHQIISEVKGNLAEEEGDHDNLQFLPEIVVCITKLMKCLPLWSVIMVPKFGYGSLTTSNAPVESIFNDIKHSTFQNVHLPTTVDRFLETHLRSLDGEMKLVAATSPRKKVLMQRETDAYQVIKNAVSLVISQNTTREDGSEVIGNNKLNNSKYKTVIISAHNPKCFACFRGDFTTGSHTCSVCGTPVHAAFSECSIPYDRSEEGYGEKRLCVKCADKVRTAGTVVLQRIFKKIVLKKTGEGSLHFHQRKDSGTLIWSRAANLKKLECRHP